MIILTIWCIWSTLCPYKMILFFLKQPPRKRALVTNALNKGMWKSNTPYFFFSELVNRARTKNSSQLKETHRTWTYTNAYSYDDAFKQTFAWRKRCWCYLKKTDSTGVFFNFLHIFFLGLRSDTHHKSKVFNLTVFWLKSNAQAVPVKMIRLSCR